MSQPFRQLVVYLGLAALTVASFGHVLTCPLFGLDDMAFIAENPHVTTGLTLDNIGWAFTTRHAGYWFPLTWLSLQLDVTLFGAQTWGFHLSNLVLHIANVLLLFGLLQRLTGAFWRSAVVAALFAVHPQHVESVAWITERKDVLSMFFGLLALWAYVAYARKPALLPYLVLSILFALSLMAKAMLVTLPCVLLLLDFWPLERVRIVTSPRLALAATNPGDPLLRIFMEKIPLLLLAIGSSTVVLLTIGSLYNTTEAPLSDRLSTASVAYLGYLEKTFWPVHLGVLYPFPRGGMSWWLSAASVGILLCVTIVLAIKKPHLLVGWFWFLGTLVPVIGLVQAGLSVAMADRFSYFPHIGLFITLVWGIAESAIWKKLHRWMQVALPLAVISCCSVLAWRQVCYWQDSMTMFLHTLELTENNDMLHQLVGTTYLRQQELDKAEKHLKEALRIEPYDFFSNLMYAQLLARRGQDLLAREPDNPDGMKYMTEAIQRYTYVAKEGAGRVLPAEERGRPDSFLGLNLVQAEYFLGIHLIHVGKVEEGKKYLRQFLKNPMTTPEMDYFAGTALLELGERAEAMKHWAKALEELPNYQEANYQMGRALLLEGKTREALDHLSRGLIGRQHAGLGIVNELRGLALTRLGRWSDAVAGFERAIVLDPGLISARADLAYAYVHEGRTELATAKYEEILKASPDWPAQAARAALQKLEDGKDQDVRRALELAIEACQATNYRQVACVDALARAYAANGRLDDALQTAHKALALAPDHPLAQKLQDQIRKWQQRDRR